MPAPNPHITTKTTLHQTNACWGMLFKFRKIQRLLFQLGLKTSAKSQTSHHFKLVIVILCNFLFYSHFSFTPKLHITIYVLLPCYSESSICDIIISMFLGYMDTSWGYLDKLESHTSTRVNKEQWYQWLTSEPLYGLSNKSNPEETMTCDDSQGLRKKTVLWEG